MLRNLGTDPASVGRRRALAIGISALWAAATIWFLQVPTDLALLVPGPAVDTLEMVAPPGGLAPDQGRLFATTVGTIPRTRVFDLLRATFVPATRTIPSRLLIPDGQSLQQFLETGHQEMEQSKAAALVAALNYAGIGASLEGEGGEIVALLDPPPPDLLKGDIIVGIEGSAVSTAWDLDRHVRTLEPGQIARLALRRGDLLLSREVPVRANDLVGPTLGIHVVTVDPRVVAPGWIDIEIETGEMIGPSAGLMMSLAALQRLSSESLTGGRSIAGTGTISPSGLVGPVGGVAQKVAGAERADARYFLVPPADYDEAVGAARSLQVVPVASLAEAVAFLRSLSAEGT